MRNVLGLWALCCSVCWSGEWGDLDFVVVNSLPAEVVEYLRSSQGHEPYVLSAWINPYYLQGDFDMSDATAARLRNLLK